MTAPTSPEPRGGRLSPTVRLLGAASFLNDVASEMITPVLPLFLTTRLGAGPAAVGLVEGVAEAASSLLKGFSGRVADRSGRSRILVVGGYAVSNAVRPLIALAASWPVVLVLRFTDRVGKGLRTAPRDALIQRTSEPAFRGRAFGFHRAMDHLGATIGPLAAFGLLSIGLSFEQVFLASAVPGAFLVALLLLRLREPTEAATPHTLAAAPVLSAGVVRRAAPALVLQSFVAVPDAFLVLWAARRGIATEAIPLVWAAAHAARSAVVRWLGAWSDGRRRTVVVTAGWVARVAALAALALAPDTVTGTVVLFIVWAATGASTEGVERALVADCSALRTAGRAFGRYHMAIGIAALPGAAAFGLVWETFGMHAAFAYAAAGTAIAAAVMAAAAGKEAPGSEEPSRPGSVAPGTHRDRADDG